MLISISLKIKAKKEKYPIFHYIVLDLKKKLYKYPLKNISIKSFV